MRINPGEVSGAAVVASILEQVGDGRVFGVPGSSMVSILYELAGAKMRFVPAVHEATAVAMADGYARLAGSAAAMLYMLPGTANGLGNLYNAWRDETPLVVLASQQANSHRSVAGTVGEHDIVGLAHPFTRHAWETRSRSALARDLRVAFRQALGPPSGPTFLSLPEDVLVDGGEPAPTDWGLRHLGRACVLDGLDDIVDRLLRSERPLIVVGGQVRRSGGSASLEALAIMLDVPVVYEPFWNDRLGIAPGHPCTFGPLTPGSRLGREADVVLVIGSRLFNEVHPRAEPWFPPGAFVVHVNADPAKVDDVGAADWSAVADPATFVALLANECAAIDTRGPAGKLRQTRLNALQDKRDRRSARTDFEVVGEQMKDVLDLGWVVDESVSGNYSLVGALRSENGERYISTTAGSLGWGVGAACGVALAANEHVVCVLGDGALFFGLPSLWSVSALDLPITLVVLDNQGYGSTRWFERQYVDHLPPGAPKPGYLGSDFRSPTLPVAAVLESFGISTTTLSTADGLGDAIARRAESPSHPAAIVVPIDFST